MDFREIICSAVLQILTAVCVVKIKPKLYGIAAGRKDDMNV